MMMTEFGAEDKLERAAEAARDLFHYARQAAEKGVAAHEVEKGIWDRVLQIGHDALACFFQQQGTGDLGETLTMPDGHEVHRLEKLHERCYHSIFGDFQLQRAVYGTREGQKIECVPLDARLQLPGSDYSYVLQDWSQALDVEHAFARTAETLRMIFGLNIPVDSLELMSRKMAESVEGFRESLPAPEPDDEGKIFVVTADNKGGRCAGRPSPISLAMAASAWQGTRVKNHWACSKPATWAARRLKGVSICW